LLEIVFAAIGEPVRREDVVAAMNDIRYAGYLKDQEVLARKRGRYDNLEIPANLEFANVSGLSHEVIQKLSRVRPRTIGQAARIPGITPAAVSILMVAALRN
jgi:tRNA uridine 5-carboxymethylaminomethyl modification enzyme